MKTYIYIFPTLLLLAACQGDATQPMEKGCELQLNLSRIGVLSSTRAIDNDLSLTILDSNGQVYIQYPAGSVPSRIVLAPGTFTVQAYTDNQDSWATANNGRGAGCYYGTCQVEMHYDAVTYCNLQVPMTNYAVTLTLPELFTSFFPTYGLVLRGGFREIEIKEGEKAYFDPAHGGFTYKLTATNTDGNSHQTSFITYKEVESGKLYNMTYYYGTADNSGGLDIEIKDNMEDEDVNVPLEN